ncbi:MAG: hypothetical protein ACI4OU_06320 [Candidatus Enterenecus sp.]
MIEEKKPETARDTADGTVKGKRRSVTLYLTILFAVAFLLLLLAYFMQQRSNRDMIGTLQNSMDITHSLNDLVDENRDLRQEIEGLEAQLEQAQADTAEAQARAQAAEAAAQSAQRDAQAQLDALRLLEQLEFLVSNQQLEEAAQLWDPALETILPALDRPEDYKPGQLTLADRVEALKLTLFPDYAP